MDAEQIKTIMDMNPKTKRLSACDGVIVDEMKSIPAGSNPFHHDLFHMGTNVNDRFMVMFSGSENSNYIILVDSKSGRRIKVSIED